MKYCLILPITFLILATSSASAGSLKRNIDDYNALFGVYQNPSTIMKDSPLNRGGDMIPKTVLKGVLYFGGSDRRRKLLSTNTLNYLCETGFSHVYSVYDKPRSSLVKCSSNDAGYSLVGQAKSSENGGSLIRKFLVNVYNVIKSDGDLGPIYLHCWYGVHASNTISQIALKQFCGTSDEQLAKNWDDTDFHDSLGRNGMKKNIQKIYNFNPFSDLQLTLKEQQAICPKY